MKDSSLKTLHWVQWQLCAIHERQNYRDNKMISEARDLGKKREMNGEEQGTLGQ